MLKLVTICSLSLAYPIEEFKIIMIAHINFFMLFYASKCLVFINSQINPFCLPNTNESKYKAPKKKIIQRLHSKSKLKEKNKPKYTLIIEKIVLIKHILLTFKDQKRAH